jgi:hypothetical protein
MTKFGKFILWLVLGLSFLGYAGPQDLDWHGYKVNLFD